jgi:[protein-PII] uridylyltransferase
MWTEWKAGLVTNLVSRCKQVMQGKGFSPPEPLDQQQRELVATAVRTGRGEVLISHDGNMATVVLAVPARTELLAPAAGVLALHSLEVHTAVLRSHGNGRAGIFIASPKFGSLPDTALLREQFSRAVGGGLALDQKLAAKERDYQTPVRVVAKPKVLWFDDETSGQNNVVLELRAPDRIGLLYRVAGALQSCDAEVRWAKVATLGGAVVDSFAVAPRGGRLDQAWRQRVEQAVLTASS